MQKFIPVELIKKKRHGETHSHEELSFIINEFVAQRLPDYQMSAWLMAVCFQGMRDDEVSHLTQIMRDSGKTLDFSHFSNLVVDKHSTGGVGDKTSLIVGPIAAAAGVPIAMIAGRGLGHTGGTLDKLESIPGFSVQLTMSEFSQQVMNHGIAIAGQSAEMCPADRLIYALRDVTGTVDSLPLICSSIMSKKLAGGSHGLVLDVKYGSGAFMKSLDEARQLAQHLRMIGKAHDLPVTALLTNMNQPLGQFVGNSLEVKECLKILNGESSPYFKDTIDLSLELSSHMILMGKKVSNLEEGRQMAKTLLANGQAAKVFIELCQHQGGKGFTHLPKAKLTLDVIAPRSGYVSHINTEAFGIAAVVLGAGRSHVEDKIDPSAGIECLVKVGSQLKKAQLMFRIYGNSQEKMNEANEILRESFALSSEPVTIPDLIAETITD